VQQNNQHRLTPREFVGLPPLTSVTQQARYIGVVILGRHVSRCIAFIRKHFSQCEWCGLVLV